MYGRHIIVVLSFKHVTSHGITQLVLGGELADRERWSSGTFVIRYSGFLDGQLLRLFVNQQNVSMKSGILSRTRTYVLNNCIPLANVTTGYVAHHPVKHLPELWIALARCIGICLKRKSFSILRKVLFDDFDITHQDIRFRKIKHFLYW